MADCGRDGSAFRTAVARSRQVRHFRDDSQVVYLLRGDDRRLRGGGRRFRFRASCIARRARPRRGSPGAGLREDVARIHQGSLEVLRDCGIKFEHPEALNILGEGGCSVDKVKMLVTFPTRIVEQYLKKIPETVYLKARNPKYDLKFSGDEVYFVNHAAPQMVDLETGKRRLQKLEDVTQLVTVIDALEDYHGCFLPAISLADKPPEVAMLDDFYLRNHNLILFFLHWILPDGG